MEVRSATIGWFVVLLLGTIVAIYAWRVRPTTRRQWIYVAIVIAFLAWILPFMVALR